MKEPKLRIPYEHTTIPPERTKADIEKLLREHGIGDVQWTTYRGESRLRFIWHLNVKGVEKEILFEFAPPLIETKKRVWTGMRTERISVQLEATAYRLLWNLLKNKLWSIKFGLETVEKEFLSHAVVSLPNGQSTTVGDRIQDVLETVRSPALTYESAKDESKIFDAEKVQTP